MNKMETYPLFETPAYCHANGSYYLSIPEYDREIPLTTGFLSFRKEKNCRDVYMRRQNPYHVVRDKYVIYAQTEGDLAARYYWDPHIVSRNSYYAVKRAYRIHRPEGSPPADE
jgi:hypothetical protein